jgi:hypothetical protein
MPVIPNTAVPQRIATLPLATYQPGDRLSDRYYGHSDPLQGLFDFYAAPPFSPGYNYGHVRPAWR